MNKCDSNGSRIQFAAGSTPRTLFINMKGRLSYVSGAARGGRKITRNITTNTSIHFNEQVYDLKAMILHNGRTVYSGHYNFAMCSGEEWYTFDDQVEPCIAKVEIVREFLMRTSQGYESTYGLMYVRRV